MEYAFIVDERRIASHEEDDYRWTKVLRGSREVPRYEARHVRNRTMLLVQPLVRAREGTRSSRDVLLRRLCVLCAI
jgi:hypothetical protein